MINMNKTFFLSKEEQTPRWRVIDAEGQIVGRLATKVADMLRGKDTAEYTPHCDGGDYVVVINAEKIVFSGDKMTEKTYDWYTGWIGGLKTLTAEQFMKKDPAFILTHAVKGMLPRNKLARHMMRRLKVYAGQEHPHIAQVTTTEQKAK
jgi:large subunit ribosomal protein L13